MKNKIVAKRYFDKENNRIYWMYTIIKNGKNIDVVEREIFFQDKIPYITYKNDWVKVVENNL